MKISYHRLVLFAFAFLFVDQTSDAQSQDAGSKKSFGPDGRLYSGGSKDFHLLWHQSGYGQGRGVETGAIRIRIKYEGGGYEEKRLYFQVECFETANPSFVPGVIFSESEELNVISDHVEIRAPSKFPGIVQKGAYNLYWAACHGQFQKFK